MSSSNILLIDADSKIPNIPLMKLSTFHKEKGDKVYLVKLNIPYYPYRQKTIYDICVEGYDKKYCSIVFNGSINYIQNKKGIIFGGTGFNLHKTLPKRIEKVDCDYSLYPDNDMSYGFITRGCIRKCKFCSVPIKEGKIKQVSTISQIVKHNKVSFLDNNILALPNHCDILNELVERKIKCRFEQGLDIRLLSTKNSNILSKLNYFKEYVFAFDNIKNKENIKQKLKLLKWRKDWRVKFFIYIHPKMPLKDTIERINYLHSNKCLPYIMRDIKCWDSQYNKFFIDIAAWCNQPHLFKNLSFETFMERRNGGKDKNRIDKHLFLYRKNKGSRSCDG